MDRNRLIAVYKGAFYSFYLPVAAAMYMAQIPDSYPSPILPKETIKPFDVALRILLQVGEYYQIQDDFLDYDVPHEQLREIGTGMKVILGCGWPKADQ